MSEMQEVVTLEEVIVRYEAYKISYKLWKTEHSIKNNRHALARFAGKVREIYGTQPDIRMTESPLILAAIERLWPDTGKTCTHKVMTGRIRAFFNWAVKQGYCLPDKVIGITSYRPEMPDLDKTYATEDEVERILTTLKEDGNHRDAYWAFLTFLFMRRGSEMGKIMVGDINLTPQDGAPYGEYWYVEGKTHRGRQRLVLRKRGAELLKEYFAWYKEQIGRELEEDDFLFPGRTPGAPAKKGQKREMRPDPKVPVICHSPVYSNALKRIDAYEPGKAGHSFRRGGMSTAYAYLEEAGYADPIALLMPQTRHKSRDAALGYIDKDQVREASNRALLDLDARQEGSIQDLQKKRVVNVSQESESEEASNVVSFEALRRRRAIG